MSSTFRASPWVSYDPTASSHHQSRAKHQDIMDDDVDMDAPQISTLRDEDSPPPQRKAIANSRKGKAAAKVQQRTAPASEEDFEDPEEEEDQLISDDDETIKAAKTISNRSAPSPQKRKKENTKQKPRKEKKTEAEKKGKEKAVNTAIAPDVAPTISWFEVTPPEAHEDGGKTTAKQIIATGEQAEPTSSKTASGKKKAAPRKAAAAPRPKAKPPKQKTVLPPLLIEDTGIVSEGYTGTAASSPVPTHFDAGSPEPENTETHTPPAPPVPLVEETNLENVPLPVYPLPSKPFPVQPPVKIGTGFAPVLPLDKNGKKVRHWRLANREIRGIAGGRWFAHTWVGEKDSEYAAAATAAASSLKSGEDKPGGVALPKLSAVSISAPLTGKKGKGSKAASRTVSAAPSRSSSAVPEGLMTTTPMTSTVRAPTKMRILQLAPSEGGDSDVAPMVES